MTTAATTTTARGKARAPIAPDKAVVPQALSREDLMALLGQTGQIAQQGGQFHRMTLNGGVLETDDGEMFPPRKDAPAVTVRIVSPPVYYNAFFLKEGGRDGAIDAIEIGRPELNGRFSRKYDDPAAQAADQNAANDVYDEIARVTGQRGKFKGDIGVQIVPPSGELTGDETVYTLALPTTSVFEFRGSSRDQYAGSATDKNFIVRLSEFAVAQAIEAGLDEAGQKSAVLNAMTALRVGGVIAEVYLPRQSSEKNNTTWSVISFVPIYIDPDANFSAPALESGEAAATEDDVPF